MSARGSARSKTRLAIFSGFDGAEIFCVSGEASSSCRLKPGKQKGFMAPRMCWSAEKNTASKLILRVVPSAEPRLDAFLPAFAGFFANVGEARLGSEFGFV